jgi:hypothetical protein
LIVVFFLGSCELLFTLQHRSCRSDRKFKKKTKSTVAWADLIVFEHLEQSQPADSIGNPQKKSTERGCCTIVFLYKYKTRSDRKSQSKKKTGRRASRPGTEAVWGTAAAALARPRASAEAVWGRAPPLTLAPARRKAGFRHFRPKQLWPKFQFSKKKTGYVHCSFVYTTRRTYKKKIQTTLSVSRRRHATMRFRRRISLPRHVFLSISLPRQRVTTVST